jgi:hypothetical protein
MLIGIKFVNVVTVNSINTGIIAGAFSHKISISTWRCCTTTAAWLTAAWLTAAWLTAAWLTAAWLTAAWLTAALLTAAQNNDTPATQHNTRASQAKILVKKSWCDRTTTACSATACSATACSATACSATACSATACSPGAPWGHNI